MRYTLIGLRKEHGEIEIDPVLKEIEKELEIDESESLPDSKEQELKAKIKEMEAELSLTDEEFESRLLGRLK